MLTVYAAFDFLKFARRQVVWALWMSLMKAYKLRRVMVLVGKVGRMMTGS